MRYEEGLGDTSLHVLGGELGSRKSNLGLDCIRWRGKKEFVGWHSIKKTTAFCFRKLAFENKMVALLLKYQPLMKHFVSFKGTCTTLQNGVV